MSYLISIDQSTTGTKVLLVDKDGNIVGKDSLGHRQYYPRTGWVEHCAEEIWQNVLLLLPGYRLHWPGAGAGKCIMFWREM